MIIAFILNGPNNNYIGAILLAIFIALGVPLIGIIIALSLRHKKPKTAKIIGIVTAVYSIIGIGYCSGLFY